MMSMELFFDDEPHDGSFSAWSVSRPDNAGQSGDRGDRFWYQERNATRP